MADEEAEVAKQRQAASDDARRTRWLTSRRRLPWLLVGIAVVPTLVVALFALFQTTSIVTGDAGRAVRSEAISAIVEIETELKRTDQETGSLATSERIETMHSDRAANRLTSEVETYDPVYRQAVLLGVDGRVVAIARRPPEATRLIPFKNFVGKSIGKPSWFEIALRNARDGRANAVNQTVERRPFIGRLEGNNSAPPTPVSAMAVMRGNRPIGVVAVFLNWTAFSSLRETMLGAHASRSASAGQGGYIIDKQGRLLLAPGGKIDLNADLTRDTLVKEIVNAQTAGYDTEVPKSNIVPDNVIAGYAPMDPSIGTPRLDWTAVVTQPTNDALRDVARLRNVLIVSTLLVALLASLIALIVSRALTRRAERLRESSVEVEDGAKAMQKSAEASQERARLTETRAEEQLTAMEQMSDLVAEMRDTSGRIAERAATVAAQAGRASSAGEDGRRAAGEVDSTMAEIDERVSGISKEISNLATQTAQIGEIVQTVSSIADQSNLLAFNATIEAAKAGEQGAGFAVVAEEVRTLAERSKRATAQIRSILGEIDKATRDAERSSEQGIASVRTGRERAERAAATIDELAAANKDAEDATRGIADAAPAQVETLGKIVDATAIASERAEELRSESHESSKSAAELDRLAERLRELAATLTNE
jgi:methyl-accepting chemotaxis protein